MTGRRRLGMKPATAPVTVVATETPHADTQVITAVEDRHPQPLSPSLAQDIREALDATERGETEDLGDFTRYADEPCERIPLPDLDSPDPADRTEWLRLHEGDETDFAAILNDHPEWLYLIGLPEPVRTAPEVAEDTTDSGSGSAPPVDAAAETTPASADPEPVSTEDEPVQDEPAEPDCAEGSEA